LDHADSSIGRQFDWQRAPKRSAPPVCAQLRRAVARSQARGRIALVLLDNLGTHTPEHSRLVRALLEELRGQLVLVYTCGGAKRHERSGCSLVDVVQTAEHGA
jgi:hypothetical protein